MKVLEHILVFEICQGVAGPTAGVTLADLGAQVIKIEPPTGDYGRQLPFQDVTLDGESLFFQVRNRNKQAVAIDFNDPKALAQLQQWLTMADVVTTNHPATFMQQYGLDYQTLTKANPQLIYATVDGLDYAWTSPTLCQDEILCQALSGLCHIQGDQADTPLPMGTHIGGLFAGVYLTQGILAALYHRQRCKKGVSVQTSTLQALIDIQCESMTTALYAQDFMPQRAKHGNGYAVLCAPYGTYKTKDDYIALGIIDIPCLFASMGLDLPDKWAHPQQWLTKREDIMACIQAKLATETTAYWLARFEAADFWCAAVHDIPTITKHPGYELVRMAQTIQTNNGEALQTTRSPFRLNGTRLTSTCGAPALQTDRSQIEALLEQRQEREKRTKLGTTHNTKNSLLTKCVDRSDKAFERNACQPLKGLVVIDLTQFLSGPTASLRLADLGAEVIKIERPKVGDAGRQIFFNNITMDNTSSCFMATARGKRSFACDLKNPQDRLLLDKLIEKADIVLQNFRPEAALRLEVDYAHIRAINPQIIYGEITGYGHEGPWVSKPGQDLVMQALSGLTSLQQAYHDAPMAMGLPVVDLYTGSRLVEGLLAAVLHKEITGEGSQVSLSMLEAAIDLEAEAITAYQYSQQAQGLAWRSPSGIYATQDGYIALGSDAVRYIDTLASIIKKETDTSLLHQGFAQENTDYWLDILQAQDIPCASVLTWHQLIDSPISRDLKLFQTVTCSNGYSYQTTACPIRFNGACSCIEKGAPGVGEHSQYIVDKHLL